MKTAIADQKRKKSPSCFHVTNFLVTDVLRHEQRQEKMATDDDTSESNDEAERFLEENPTRETEDLKLRKEVEIRIKAWIKSGIGKKDIKDSLLEKIPRKGQLNLEAPVLNEEIIVDLHPKAAARDDHFREYQNLTGAALSTTALVLSQILGDFETPLDRDSILNNLSSEVKVLSDLFFSLTQARKTFLVGKYEEKLQKILKKVEPTTWLFGDNLKGLLETSRAMEKVSREMKTKAPRGPLRSLNWRSSVGKKEVARGSNYQNKPNTSRHNYKSRTSGPARKYYPQAQPQQNRRQ